MQVTLTSFPLTSRRQFLTTAGVATAALATGGLGLAGCSSGDASSGGGGAAGLRWWDHFGALQKFHAEFAQSFAAKSGIPTEFTYYEVAKLGPALQLAKQSNQLPDIHTTAGLTLPTAALIKDNWFQPIQFTDEAKKRSPEGTLVEGIHVFDGKTYSFPLFTPRQYSTANWFNKDLAEPAGIDPANPPSTYDDFRAACSQVTKSKPGTYGFVIALNNPGRMGEQINDLAQAGGFEGLNGMRFKDGQFGYHEDAYVNPIEFWKSLNQYRERWKLRRSFSDYLFLSNAACTRTVSTLGG